MPEHIRRVTFSGLDVELQHDEYGDISKVHFLIPTYLPDKDIFQEVKEAYDLTDPQTEEIAILAQRHSLTNYLMQMMEI